MQYSWLVPVLIVGTIMFRQVAITWIRAKHGYPIRDRRSGRHDDIDSDRKISLLTSENERLTGQVSRLEERIAVLERIATDPAERTAREIDSLR